MNSNPLRRSSRRANAPTLAVEMLEERRLLSTNVLTYHNDLARTGANLTETVLTPANVNAKTFGQLFSYPVDGQVYAQPLYMANVAFPDARVHNVIFAATENDSVYAFDANDPTAGPNGDGILWQDSFIDPAKGISTVSAADVNCRSITPQMGITATPVIDPNLGMIYVEAATEQVIDDVMTFHDQLHALAITTGKECLGGPVEIQAADLVYVVGNRILTFDPGSQLERAGLVLANGVVYTSWSSHCDQLGHGWVIGYDARTLQQDAVFITSPNSQLATIWASAPAVDAQGDLFFATGNGGDAGDEFDPDLGDYPETVLHLSRHRGLTVADYFTPSNWAVLDQADKDLGSGGVMLLPDQPGPIPHLLIIAGKEGTIYLIDRDNMGQFHTDVDNIVQEVPNAILGWGSYGTPAYFSTGAPDQRWVYFAGQRDVLRAFQLFDDGTLSTSSTSQSSNEFDAPHGATPSLSANGNTSGIVWAISPGLTPVLYAYDATNVAIKLYDSSQAGTRDQLDPGVKFSVPTIADGKVLVGTVDTLSVFGLLSGASTSPTPKGPHASLIDAAIAQLLSVSIGFANPTFKAAPAPRSPETIVKQVFVTDCGFVALRVSSEPKSDGIAFASDHSSAQRSSRARSTRSTMTFSWTRDDGVRRGC